MDWVQTAEGRQALHDDDDVPKMPEVQQALLAVAKGKGKGNWNQQGKGNWNAKGNTQNLQKCAGKGKGGKGKGDKGKGKGNYVPRPFTGNCHNCGEAGHYARDCPNPPSGGIRSVEDNRQRYPWQGASSSVTLCVTDSIFTGYRQD